jgi:hypothetical protein
MLCVVGTGLASCFHKIREQGPSNELLKFWKWHVQQLFRRLERRVGSQSRTFLALYLGHWLKRRLAAWSLGRRTTLLYDVRGVFLVVIIAPALVDAF